MSDVQKPHAKFRIGKISATVWLIEAEDRRPFYSTTIARTYKNDDGQLKESNSFGHADLPAVAKVADRAEEWIAANPQAIATLD